jgi:hypothetical protein
LLRRRFQATTSPSNIRLSSPQGISSRATATTTTTTNNRALFMVVVKTICNGHSLFLRTNWCRPPAVAAGIIYLLLVSSSFGRLDVGN